MHGRSEWTSQLGSTLDAGEFGVESMKKEARNREHKLLSEVYIEI